MSSPFPEVHGPYKGPESYQAEDADLFFGREQEAAQLVSTILSARMTVLHAPSGAGKTSLLNARVVPHLEARSWIPVRILPQNDPIESTRVTTLQYVMPTPESEIVALDRAVTALAPEEPLLSLEELLARYDKLEVSDPLSRVLISPVESPQLATAGVLPTSGKVVPYFCRLLRRSLEVSAFATHLAAVAGNPEYNDQISYATPLQKIREVLSSTSLASMYRELVSRLYTPVPGLRLFFENLCEVYGERLTDFALVLIFDQFEELFTRFVDPGPIQGGTTDLPNWRLRPQFFEELENLYLPGVEPHQPKTEATFLPIRFVVSLRDEYIARLESLRLFAPEISDSFYHLGFLGLEAARTAIQNPARHYKSSYSAACMETILKQLTREDRFIEPSHLQIVCEKIWSHLAKQWESVDGTSSQNGKEINVATLNELNGVQGILRSFLSEFMNELSAVDRLEVLEILEPLITASGTRNIIEITNLISPPFRDPGQRTRLMDILIRRRLIRTEWRLGGYFAEITHEFLIQPILEEVATATMNDPDYGRLRGALQGLARFQGIDFRGPAMHLLTADDFRTLDRSQDRILWTPWAVELMLRSSVVCQVDRRTIREWAACYEATGELPDAQEILAARGNLETRDLLFSREELRQIYNQREDLELSEEQQERILRSALWEAVAEDRECVRYWTRRLFGDEA